MGLAATVSATRMTAELVQAKIGATTLVDKFMDYKMPVTVVMSVMFFMLFKNMRIKNRAAVCVIGAIAPLSFGVYLLHNSAYICKILWENARMARFGGVLLSLLYMILLAAVIMAAGYAVSFVYNKIYAVLPTKKRKR